MEKKLLLEQKCIPFQNNFERRHFNSETWVLLKQNEAFFGIIYIAFQDNKAVTWKTIQKITTLVLQVVSYWVAFNFTKVMPFLILHNISPLMPTNYAMISFTRRQNTRLDLDRFKADNSFIEPKTFNCPPALKASYPHYFCCNGAW